MYVLAALIVCAALFVGFLYLTARETRRGTRAFSRTRASLDRTVDATAEKVRGLNVPERIVHFVADATKRVVHDVAHVLLVIVEIIQSVLRSIIMRLRRSREAAPPRAFIEHMRSAKRPPEEPKEEARSEVE